MSSYTIHINDKSTKAQTFINFLRDYVKDNVFIEIEELPNETTRKAIEEARRGKLHKVESVKHLFDSI